MGNANTNIDSLANWQIPSNIKVTEIAGWGESTIKGIDYKSKQKILAQLRVDYIFANPKACGTENF